MTSEGYVKGIISIHVTELANSPHIDFDDIKNLTIHEVENYGATGTVQLVNNYPVQNENLLSNYCDLWTDGAQRKLDRAMFLRIYHDSRTEANAIGVFLITQINASDGLITLTFCDSVQYLRSVGVDYVRNHYAKGSSKWYDLDTVWQSGEARILHPDGAVIHGSSHHDIIMGKMHRVTYSNKDEEAFMNLDLHNHVDFIMNLGREVKRVHKVTISNIYISQHPKPMNAYIALTAGSIFVTYDFVIDRTSSGWKSFTFTYDPAMTGSLNEIRIALHFHLVDSPLGPGTVTIGMKNNVNNSLIYLTGKSSEMRKYENRALDVDFISSYDTDNIVGTNYTSYFKVDTMDGEAPTEESIRLVEYHGRSRGLFIDPGSRISAGDVFKSILSAVDFTCDNIGGRAINTFRCNGDYIHNYLLALADMPNGDRQYAFRSSPTVWNKIKLGFRQKKTDQTAIYFYYAYFGAIEGGTPMMSFNPSISMKNHPRMSVVKGSTEDKKPIMIALVDPNIRIGSAIPSVNGSVTTAVDGALATYSDIITNRSDDWQGEITISGIHLDYFTRGGSIGGIPISISDHRYGFLDYKAKVKEITWDFANQKTTIVVNNYSEIYSNAILDTTKMAYSAGDMSAEATNVDMFCRQFVNIIATDQTSTGTTSNVSFHVSSGTDGSVTDATTIDLPELGIRVVNAYFPPGTGVTDVQYGVVSVKVGNRTHNIPEPIRPDKHTNQSLIVNVIYKLT